MWTGEAGIPHTVRLRIQRKTWEELNWRFSSPGSVFQFHPTDAGISMVTVIRYWFGVYENLHGYFGRRSPRAGLHSFCTDFTGRHADV
jgi:hypothetical protein